MPGSACQRPRHKITIYGWSTRGRSQAGRAVVEAGQRGPGQGEAVGGELVVAAGQAGG
jgi:hypothetical protein